MNLTLLPELKGLFYKFKGSEDYQYRVKQYAIVNLNRQIIKFALNKPLFNTGDLTAFIQLFKFGCSDPTFDKYIAKVIDNETVREQIIQKAIKIDQWGYTGAGLNSIGELLEDQLNAVHAFLTDAFAIETIDQAINLCRAFDVQKVPYVTSGIYSPWLYYINPSLFPILNNSHTLFRKWIGINADYPSCIQDFNEIKKLLGEHELGTVDMFAHNFKKYQEESQIRIIDLKGQQLFKISHGIFRKNKKYRVTAFESVLENNNWISLSAYTGKGQGAKFKVEAKLGDYVYICYGSEELYCLARITSEALPLDESSDELIQGGGEWIFRHIEPIVYPADSSLKNLKKDTRFFMPSGNSTFYKIPLHQLEEVNQKLFTPKFNIKIANTQPETQNMPNSINEELKHGTPYNKILFGPPGTGKTYHTINEALKIVALEEYTRILNSGQSAESKREDIKDLFQSYVDNGQIAFCTFHQSMAYEDFIEGIKPSTEEYGDGTKIVTYDIQDGIFKQLAIKASYDLFLSSKPSKEQLTTEETNFDGLWDSLLNDVQSRLSNNKSVNLTTRLGTIQVIDISDKGNIILKHGDDRNRSYIVSYNRLKSLYDGIGTKQQLEQLTNINHTIRSIIGGCNATAYYAVLSKLFDISPVADEIEIFQEPSITYLEQKDAVEKVGYSYLKQLEKVSSGNKFVLIIDEINRANVSQVFGELITLIEDDKRLGNKESLPSKLPYSKQPFWVPNNLFVIGTMNTADRSVESLDTALRRRFVFQEMPPRANLIKEEGKSGGVINGLNLQSLLERINERIEILLDRDHLIGHSFFMNVNSIGELKQAIINKVLPLLQEYFYGDYGKIGLVLGEGFVQLKKLKNDKVFADFKNYDTSVFEDKQSYWLVDYNLKDEYELIIDGNKFIVNFEKAIELLVN